MQTVGRSWLGFWRCVRVTVQGAAKGALAVVATLFRMFLSEEAEPMSTALTFIGQGGQHVAGYSAVLRHAMGPRVKLFSTVSQFWQSLHPIAEGYPNNKNLLPQIQNFLNTCLKGATTYCNQNSPAGLANTTLEETLILKPV